MCKFAPVVYVGYPTLTERQCSCDANMRKSVMLYLEDRVCPNRICGHEYCDQCVMFVHLRDSLKRAWMDERYDAVGRAITQFQEIQEERRASQQQAQQQRRQPQTQ